MQEHVRRKAQQTETQGWEYLHAKEHEAEQKAAAWLKNMHTQWEHEYAMQRKQAYNDIADEIDKKWAEFRREKMSLLEERLRQRLTELFPVLAKCFIAKLSKKYDTGTFVLPDRYASLVKKEGFEVKISRKERVVFRKGNLYIEYSVERIMVELGDEIIAGMHLEEDIWQR